MKLIFDNCRLYNMEGCMIYTYADKCDKMYNTLIKPVKDRGEPLTEFSKFKLRIGGEELRLEDMT